MRKKIYFIILLLICVIFLKNTKCLAINIPKIYFEGDISQMNTKFDEREIILRYTSKNLNFEKYAKIKIQGSSSLAYEKKNYTINLYEDNSFKQKSNIDIGQGWGAQSKYNLKANWIDKTHSRNIVAARIAGKVQKKYNVLNDLPNHGSIDGFPVEIYINNGFLGLYTWNIPKDEWLWNMDKKNSNHIVLGGAWFTEYVNLKTELANFDGTGWEIEVGEINQETINNFNRLVRFINSSDEEFINNFDQYLNKDACLDYLVMVYMMEGIDNTGKNMMLITYDNGKIWYPCLYDLDSTFGTWTDGRLVDSYRILPEDEISNHSTNNLILKMIKCFPNEISDRWFELRADIFSKESILDEFNTFENSIPEETFQKETERWKNIPGYEISQINDFLDFRLDYIDNIMYEIRTDSANKNENFNYDAIIFCIFGVIIFYCLIVLLLEIF